jgi:2-oxo-4-hydroxy-4-carboxy-5-ureidoimidazoline decarboxylase
MSEPLPDERTAVTALDLAPADAATGALRTCCASARWLDEVVAGRPYVSLDALVEASGAALGLLSWDDVLEALAAHPRIGERAQGADVESQWSRGEQSGAAAADPQVAAALLAGNVEYEDRFGYVFLICATGLSGEQMLASLRERIGHDADAEQGAVRGELAKIVDLRLRKAYR